MARPPAKELTERELEVMHVFWNRGDSTIAEVRDALAEAGLDRAYTTVATLVRILADKGFLEQTKAERPFGYRPCRSYEDVSRKLLGELLDRVFRGSREQLLVRLDGAEGTDAKGACLAWRSLARKGERAVNALGPILLSSMAHATVFALFAALFYVAWRRFSPAAGAIAAGSGLMIMAIVSLLVVGPWPRWWELVPDRLEEGTTTIVRARQESGEDSRVRQQQDEKPASEESAAENPLVPRPPQDVSATSAWLKVLFTELNREMRHPAAGKSTTLWRWPEWVAIGFLACLGLGVARLVLGIWAIRRLRVGSLPVDDRELIDAIDVLRAEMSCSQQIEIRETPELGSAATIGWRRPLLLLPVDWRDWNEAERLAVLAHEVAHVRRRDFLAGLLAQLCLALHFYHPLAHWLAARLRLEQELAADSWAARLVGGKPAYLATLAHFALRRDSRSLSWPARAFLPSRGTFVRRIEMLRNTNAIQHASLSRVARALTLGFLATVGLLVAGLRGPSASDAAFGEQPGPTSGLAPQSGTESYNLAFLPADTKMVLAIRPKTLLERLNFALADQIKQVESFKAIESIRIEDVDQLLVFWESSFSGSDAAGSPTLVPLPSGVVLRMTKPQEWKAVLSELLPSPREVRHAGQTYLTREGPAARGWVPAAFVADDRTLVIAHEDLLRELIEDRAAPASSHAWDEAWQKVAKGQMMLAVDMRWVRRRLAQGFRGGPAAPGRSPAGDVKFDTISPLLEKTQSYALAIDTADGVVVDLVGIANSENDTKPVADTFSAVLTLAKNAVEGMRSDLRGQRVAAGDAIEWALQAAGKLLDKTRIDTSVKVVHVQSKTSLDIGDAVKGLAPAISAAQGASRRAQSQNNLKQIGLAIHNYASVNNLHLPSPVLYGGPNKSVPYSWRVAILPYLEQNELYKQYDFDEPWDGPNNRKLIDKMPSTYGYPGVAGSLLSRTNASYFVLTGTATAFGVPAGPKDATGITFADITDGSSNTIMVVEAKREIPWTKPEDIPFDPNGPLPELGGFARDVFEAGFADGSVRAISYRVNPSVLKALITRAGGKVISLDSFGAEPTRTQTATSTATPKP